ncbi:hypothetical protein TRICI_006324 [Trichomonascus ciferrii]|uniref:FAD/NAD(P)-binding domain-containing protein n=1 Tax=Trichomonascus ciferrii TaxID=44093 RepID=A0A642UKI1_9ASCO|nr:hypothetical protein TRICI_006324 [Trichomonascus ciferrii]
MGVFDVVVIGGSTSGISSALALARVMVNTLVVDSGKPCNRYASESHNFLGYDGVSPASFVSNARTQLEEGYKDYVTFRDGVVQDVKKEENGLFKVFIGDSTPVESKKVIFCSGIKDKVADAGIENLEKFWGKSVIHCPYCHGLENKDKKTALLLNDPDMVHHVAPIVVNLASKLTILTNGGWNKDLTEDHKAFFSKRPNVNIIDKKVTKLHGEDGQLTQVEFEDASTENVEVMYTHPPYELNNLDIIKSLGVALNDLNLIEVSQFQQTNVSGVLAAGDATTRMRSLAVANQQGQLAGVAAATELRTAEW